VTPARARWLRAALVAGATLLVFLPALGNGFVNWDDDENFLWNPHYRGLAWANLRWMFTAVHQGLYVPMAWVTLGLDYVLWGMNPAGYHLTSVVLHAVNAALLCLVAERLYGHTRAPELHPPVPERWSARAVRLGAGAAALFFALHPLRVESVAWVTERRDVVAGLFTLLAVLAYLNAQPAGGAGRLRRGWYWTAVAAFGLALLAKSIVVGLPLVLLALDIYPLRRAGIRRLLVEKLPFAGLSAAISAVTLGILAGRDLLATSATIDLAQRLTVSAYGLAFYVAKTLVPWPLSPIYPLVHPVAPGSARYLMPAVAVVCVTALLLLAARRWPAGLAAWAAYVLLLVPVLGLFHSGPQIAADRYSYFSGMPLAVLVGGGVAGCASAADRGVVRPALGRAAAAGIAMALLGLSALTVRQVAVWRDSVSLWQHAAVVEPESDIPVFYLGWALDEAGRPTEARAHFTRALARVPADLPVLRAQLLLHRGIVAQRAGDSPAAAADFRDALAVDPEHPVAQIRLAIALAAQGAADEAGAAFARAAALSAVWPRYQLWEIRAAVREVPADQAGPRRDLGRALGALLSRHGVREPAERDARP
jgi:protein O-mannosyl-transferase